MDHVANYPVIRKLGEGATSEVFLCQDTFRSREVAVKRIFPEALRDPVRGRLFRKLFFTEASLAGKLDHPHIAQIYDAGIGEHFQKGINAGLRHCARPASTCRPPARGKRLLGEEPGARRF